MAETTRKPAAKTVSKAAATKSTAPAKAKTKTTPPVAAAPARKSGAATKTTAAPAASARSTAPKAASTTAGRKTVKAVKTTVRATSVVISDEQRYKMIAEAAYFRAESSQFTSDPVRDWIEAEKDIATLLNGRSAH